MQQYFQIFILFYLHHFPRMTPSGWITQVGKEHSWKYLNTDQGNKIYGKC